MHTHTHESRQHFRKHLRTYIWVFVALLVGTALTVGAYYVHMPSIVLAITLALIIAGTKASLVAGFFMHLVSERRPIYLLLGFTLIFLLGLLLLTVWSEDDVIRLPTE